MAPPLPRLAFYAPLKHPDHPVPSGERRVARLLLSALKDAGFEPVVVSTLRSLDKTGDPDKQEALRQEADNEAARLEQALRNDPPALWFTYHHYYKAPDLLGPLVAATFNIPYVLAEASHAPKRLAGPWARFADLTLSAIQDADLIYMMSKRDQPMLETARDGAHGLITLAPFLEVEAQQGDVNPAPPPRDTAMPVRLVTVAMMRQGDKLASYQILAEALKALPAHLNWTLDIIGDGPCRSPIEAFFEPVKNQVAFKGQIDDPLVIKAQLQAADLFVWPGVGEAYGMAYLEAQAAGTPVAALDYLGVQTVVTQGKSGWLAPHEASDPSAEYSHLLASLIQRPDDLTKAGSTARQHVLDHHSATAAATCLKTTLGPLIAKRALS